MFLLALSSLILDYLLIFANYKRIMAQNTVNAFHKATANNVHLMNMWQNQYQKLLSKPLSRSNHLSPLNLMLYRSTFKSLIKHESLKAP